MKQLLTIVPYVLTGDEIGKIKSLNKTYSHCSNFLPEFVFTDKPIITESEFYLQFVGEGESKYWMFDFLYADGVLDEEMTNEGLVDFLRPFSVDILKIITNHVQPYTYDEMGRRLITGLHLVFKLRYSGENEDVDLEVLFVGHLDEEFKLVEYVKEKDDD